MEFEKMQYTNIIIGVVIASILFVIACPVMADDNNPMKKFGIEENDKRVITLPFNAEATLHLITGDITATNLVWLPSEYVITRENGISTLIQRTNRVYVPFKPPFKPVSESTPAATPTERWSHLDEKTGYDACDYIERTYNTHVSWRKEQNGKEYCVFMPDDPLCDSGGCWYLKIDVNEVYKTDFNAVLVGADAS